jgi:hypothetical protein
MPLQLCVIREEGRNLGQIGDVGRAAFTAEQIDCSRDVALGRPAARDVTDVIGEPAVLMADEDDRIEASSSRRHSLVGSDLRTIETGEGDIRGGDRRVIFSHALGAAWAGRRRSWGGRAFLGRGGLDAVLGQHGGGGRDAPRDMQHAVHHVAARHEPVDVVLDELVDEIAFELAQFPGHLFLHAWSTNVRSVPLPEARHPAFSARHPAGRSAAGSLRRWHAPLLRVTPRPRLSLVTSS